MSILDTFQKNFDSLKSDFTEYKDYHDTMVTVIPSILELLDSLFLEENIKSLDNYKLLKEDYLDVIKRTLDPESYKDVKFEAELPDIYDAPRVRREKAKRITKLKSQKVSSLPAKIAIPNRGISNSNSTSNSTSNSSEIKGIETDIGEKNALALSKALATKVPSVTKPHSDGPNPNPNPNQKPQVDKALLSYAQEGKRLYNYNSPLECERRILAGPPDKVLIELPDETRAYLHNDGRIIDHQERNIGKIERNGIITLNNVELGRIHLVDRDETKFVNLTNNFGKLM
jgi:hypothetical protein